MENDLKDLLSLAIRALVIKGISGTSLSVLKRLEQLHSSESGIAKKQLEAMLKANQISRAKNVPMCQDTGTAIFYVTLGNKSGIDPLLIEQVIRDVIGSEKLLRKNAITPLTRQNKGNLGKGIPVIEWEFSEGSSVSIVYVAKGGGSENASTLAMLNPNAGKQGIEQFVLDHIKNLGAKACPPYVIGIAIGGTADRVLALSKKAMIREWDTPVDPSIAQWEKDLLIKINSLGIGVMGFGGPATCLKVNIEEMETHIASLPAAISVSCWALRKATLILERDSAGKIVSRLL